MDKRPKYASNYREQMVNALNKEYKKSEHVLTIHELTELFELDYNRSKGFVHSVRSKWLKANGMEVRTYSPKKTAKFGIFYESITKAQYEKLHEEQNGKCGLCGRKRKLVVDHCHKSGRVRKLLCSSCNTGLGLFSDSPSLLRRAATFISDMFIDHSTEELLEKANKGK